MAEKPRKSPTKPSKRIQTLTIRLSDEMMEELRLSAVDEMRTLSGQVTYFVARGLERWREERGKSKKTGDA
jgi:hypothetical protein